jgi:hypothetical protein
LRPSSACPASPGPTPAAELSGLPGIASLPGALRGFGGALAGPHTSLPYSPCTVPHSVPHPMHPTPTPKLHRPPSRWSEAAQPQPPASSNSTHAPVACTFIKRRLMLVVSRRLVESVKKSSFLPSFPACQQERSVFCVLLHRPSPAGRVRATPFPARRIPVISMHGWPACPCLFATSSHAQSELPRPLLAPPRPPHSSALPARR